MTTRESSYRERVRQQKDQYADMSALKRLPAAYRYWAQQFVQPKIATVFEARSHVEIYAGAFARAQRSSSNPLRLLSVGAGDGQLEVAIAERLQSLGVESFTIVLTELSEVRLQRAHDLVAEKALTERFDFRIVDFNDWRPDTEFHGVMAHHTLHHIVELERTFESIHECLSPHGRFVVMDMIGRNGHMRWPETLEIVEKFWAILPQKYKFNHQFQRTVDPFDNWDCSRKGFEGIRSQDILPLLTDRFSFSHFLGVGGAIDVFVERGYGHNFDPEDQTDRAWIEVIATLNDALLATGEIKPTMAFAILRKQGTPCPLSTHGGMTPLAAIREP